MYERCRPLARRHQYAQLRTPDAPPPLLQIPDDAPNPDKVNIAETVAQNAFHAGTAFGIPVDIDYWLLRVRSAN